jgi:hypothetical protein
VKLVKGEGCATRARSLASPRRAGPWPWRGVAWRVVSRRVRDRDRDRDREAYALFLSFMSVIHVSCQP